MPADLNIMDNLVASQVECSLNMPKYLRFNIVHPITYAFHLKLPTLFLIMNINAVPEQMPMMAINPL